MARRPSPAPPDPPGIPALRRSLLAWYRRHARDLPWRGSADPYAVLVSEFMLQQTRVAVVLPRFPEFLARFPTLRSLAEADEEAVRAAWSGLGYYRRARALHESVRRILRDHGGILPADPGALAALPGVGDYTAAALASIVHGAPRAAVDGNVARVLSRLTAWRGPANGSAGGTALRGLAGRLLAPRRPGDWNQAMMELGALVCLPAAPRCDACPWRGACRARAEGNPGRYPARRRRREPVAVERAVAVLRRGRAVLLVRRRDPRLLDGVWELPGLDVPDLLDAKTALALHLDRDLRRSAAVGAELARIRHAITHRRITVRAFATRTEPAVRARGGARAWVRAEELGDYPTSSMTGKLFSALARYLES